MAQGDSTKKFDAPQVHFIKKAVKADTKMAVTVDPLLMEDEFQSLYFTPHKNTNVIVEPPFNPMQLASLLQRNNTLQQCVTAMEVNIDGSGYEFELLEAEEDTVTGDNPESSKNPTYTKEAPQKVNVGDSKDQNPGGFIQNVNKQSVRKFAPPQQPLPPSAPGQISPPTAPANDNSGTTSVIPKGTPQGGVIQDKGQTKVVDKEKEMLEHFFKEPFPTISFTTMRRKLRVDMEATGNGYMEVIRNVAGDIIFLRQLESVSMRLVKLDAPTDVEVTITRSGKEVTAVMPMRERRFCYKIGANLTYYREFGASRQVNRKTGAWIEKGAPAEKDASLLGSEVLHFRVLKDFRTHYGLPRWINQLPSILGSRKAEEFNLEFFDAGGMPPAVIFVQGGALVGGVKEQLQQYLSGKASQKHRAAIVEVMSTSGSLDSAGSVQVKTERFGASAQDAMFQNYDTSCGDHIRRAFRLPKVLIGDTSDINRATAEAAIQAAENQVFQPERFEFDEVINNTIVKALGSKKYVMRSLNMTLADPEIQIEGLKSSWNLISGESYIDTINEISGLNLEYSAEAEAANKAAAQPPGGVPPDDGSSPDGGAPADTPPQGIPDAGGPPPPARENMGMDKPPQVGQDPNASNNGSSAFGAPPFVGQGPNMAQKTEKPVRLSPTELVKLASDWAVAMGLVSGTLQKEEKISVLYSVDSLQGEDRKFFDSVIVQKIFKATDPDAIALLQSCGCD